MKPSALATAADIVGHELPDSAAEDSVSFLPSLIDPTANDGGRVDLVHHSLLGVFSIRQGKWKLIVDCDNSGDVGRGTHGGRGTPPSKDQKGQLYDLENDPYEVYNLIDVRSDKAEELRNLYETYLSGGAPALGRRTQSLPAAVP